MLSWYHSYTHWINGYGAAGWDDWKIFIGEITTEFKGRRVADFVVLSQDLKGSYKRPFTSRDFICNEKEKRHKRNIMFIPFFFHLRYAWLVRGRSYMPGQRHESHHKICNLRYGTPGYRMNYYYKLEFKILFYFQNKLQSFYQQQFLQVSKPIK